MMQANQANDAAQVAQTGVQWIPVIATLIGGGAMGAVITALVTKYKSKQQPIIYTKEIIEVFKKNPEVPSLQAALMVGNRMIGTGTGVGVEYFSIARFTITNKGNTDMEEFKFGATLEETSKAVDVKVETPDRHHVLEVLTPLGPADPQPLVDFAAKPFNRGNTYKFNIYYTYREKEGPINLSTPHPTRFVETSTTNEATVDNVVNKLQRTSAIILMIFFVMMMVLQVIASELALWLRPISSK